VILKRATTKAIKYACLNFHYAKCVPAVQFAYNVYNSNNEWCGVVCFGQGATPNIIKQFGMIQGEVLELVRVALNGKQEYTSQAVAMALKQLHKDNPLVKLIASFADNRQHHIGTIYQATNWIYLGKTDLGAKEYLVNGKWLHPRTLSNYSISQRKRIRENNPSRKIGDKFKYIFVYDKRLRKQYLKQALPYPKDKDLS
jgi:hypothetical protein